MRTGAMLWEAPELDHLAAAGGTIVGRRVEIEAIDAASGQELWSAPGRPSYGGFLAVGDGVIAVLDLVGPDSGAPGLVAYELSSGIERWRATPTPAAEPQMIDGTSLVLLWEGELAVLSTTDGATVWSATEPFGSPLMNSVGSNGDSVFVAINSLPWAD
jgi:outer membrane protein assembly factor BamB